MSHNSNCTSCLDGIVSTPVGCGIDPCFAYKTGTDLVRYNGANLPCSGIDTCDSVTVALQKIDTKICPEELVITIINAITNNSTLYNLFCNAISGCTPTTTTTSSTSTSTTTSTSTSTTTSTSTSTTTTTTTQDPCGLAACATKCCQYSIYNPNNRGGLSISYSYKDCSNATQSGTLFPQQSLEVCSNVSYGAITALGAEINLVGCCNIPPTTTTTTTYIVPCGEIYCETHCCEYTISNLTGTSQDYSYDDCGDTPITGTVANNTSISFCSNSFSSVSVTGEAAITLIGCCNLPTTTTTSTSTSTSTSTTTTTTTAPPPPTTTTTTTLVNCNCITYVMTAGENGCTFNYTYCNGNPHPDVTLGANQSRSFCSRAGLFTIISGDATAIPEGNCGNWC